MIIVHTIATESILVIPFLLSWLSNSERSFGEFLYGLFNFLTAWAAAIGFIGGAVFCALERRSLDRQRKLNKHRLFLTQYRLE